MKAIGGIAQIGGLFSKGFFKGVFSWAGFGMLVGQRLLTPKQIIEGPRLLDLTIQAAEYGWRVPKIFGTIRSAGAIVWSAGLTEVIEDSSAGTGKGPPEPTVREYFYTWNGAIVLCEAPIERIVEIRYNDEVIYYDDGVTALGYSVTRDNVNKIVSGIRTSTVDLNWGAEPTVGGEISDNSTMAIYYGGLDVPRAPYSLLEAEFGVGKTPTYPGDVVIYFGNFDCGTNGLGTFSFKVLADGGDLEDAVTYLYGENNIPATDIDATDLAGLGTIDGLILEDRSPAANYIQLLSSMFFFDTAHIDGKEVCVPRGGTVVATLPQDDIRAFSFDGQGQGKPDTVWSRRDGIEVPTTQEIQYISTKRDYHPNIQTSSWEADPESDMTSIAAQSVPMVLTDERAKQVVTIQHHLAHIERTEAGFQCGSEYRYLAPGDIVNVTVRDVAHRFRLLDAQRRDYGVIAWKMVRDVAEIYEAPLGEEAIDIGTPTIQQVGDLYILVIDAPCARDTDTNYPGAYCAVTMAYDAGFVGHYVRFKDEGQAFINNLRSGHISEILRLPATMGTAVGALGDYEPDTFASGSQRWDNTNTVTVDLVRGTLASASEDDVLNGANAAFLGDDDNGWEIIQWTAATYDEPGSPADRRRYVLSGLLRGRRGTENAIPTHSAGDTFLLLDSAVGRFELDPSYLGRALEVSVLTGGGRFSPSAEVASHEYTVDGISMKPIAPIDLEEMSYRESDGALVVAGQIRSRLLDNFFVSGAGLRMGPFETTTVRVQILDAPAGAVLRTLTATADSDGQWAVTYSAALQTTDFGSPQASIAVKVQQNSTSVGYGFECEVEI